MRSTLGTLALLAVAALAAASYRRVTLELAP
jgi:hypothetical protein